MIKFYKSSLVYSDQILGCIWPNKSQRYSVFVGNYLLSYHWYIQNEKREDIYKENYKRFRDQTINMFNRGDICY